MVWNDLWWSNLIKTMNHKYCTQQCVHPTPEKHRGHDGGSLRVFRQFAWLEVGSVKMALSRPTHQRVTLTVGRWRGSVGFKLIVRDVL